MGDKSKVTPKQQAENTKILQGLLALPENRFCAECNSRGPRWASVNLGIFLCFRCSGIHRSLGVHISQINGQKYSENIKGQRVQCDSVQVRSITLDTWLPNQVKKMQDTGNERAREYYEFHRPESSPRPKESSDARTIEQFARAKYERKSWIRKDSDPQPEKSANERVKVRTRSKPEKTTSPPPAAVTQNLLAGLDIAEAAASVPDYFSDFSANPPPPASKSPDYLSSFTQPEPENKVDLFSNNTLQPTHTPSKPAFSKDDILALYNQPPPQMQRPHGNMRPVMAGNMMSNQQVQPMMGHHQPMMGQPMPMMQPQMQPMMQQPMGNMMMPQQNMQMGMQPPMGQSINQSPFLQQAQPVQASSNNFLL